ncbi:collagenase [Streptomyces sp. NPDC096198]|uniref:collagenase n=1 Tax=Streptomyces sp. NPDC096198 TaxID=3366080 RepID=UPI00382457EA
MRYSPLPGRVAGALAAGITFFGLLAPPALASPGSYSRTESPAAAVHGATPSATTGTGASAPPAPTGSTLVTPGHAVQNRRTAPDRLPPLRAAVSPRKPDTTSGPGAAAKAVCSPADFGSRSGSALVAFVRASTMDCVNSLFTVTGADAGRVFGESRMITVAKAFGTTAQSYDGDNSDGIWQLVLFLRAGYYVQFNDPSDTGPYDARLTSATARALDTFLAARHTKDVTAANGDVLGEAVILTDSANLQGRYLAAYRRLLGAYDSSYDAFPSMVAAVNDVYTPLWRGNWNPSYVDAVTADPRILGTLHTFALRHLDLLGTDSAYLDSNAGMSLARHVEHSALTSLVRPAAKDLLDTSSITGPTAQLWVAVATQLDSYAKADCAYYGTCDLTARLTEAALPVTHACDSAHTIRAQSLTAEDLDAACASLLGQDPYVHRLVKDPGQIPGQYESTIQLVVFASRTDYQTYAGQIYGVSTDNGGITLVGDPADPGNQPTSIMYQKAYDDGFTARIWNLNHEYTHYLDARYDMKGDFTQQTAVPDIWWIEGLAEYVSYSYRGITDDEAVTEAGKHTYTLSTLFQSTYANSDETRTYPWGYLAVRYMVEKHPADIQRMLDRFRAGDYPGGYAVYGNDIGTRYDADFDAWLTACAAGACAGPGTGGQRTGGSGPVG